MKTSTNEIVRQVIFVLLLLGTVAGAWYFVFRPRDTQDRQMRMQIEAKQRQLQKLNRATATIGNLKSEIAELEKAIAFFHSKLPSEKEIDKVLEEVWRLAEANRLTTKGIYTARRSSASTFVSEGSGQTEQPIRMEFEGDFPGFYGFLLALENQPRIMRVSKMDIEVRDPEAGRIRAEVEMSIFFERQNDNKGPKPWSRKT